MLGDVEPTFTQLFEQLGLDSGETEIEQFIKTHQISADTNIVDASFWNDGQKQFLRQKLLADDHWAPLVDELNQQLHQDSQPK